jgi:hypothetical protein
VSTWVHQYSSLLQWSVPLGTFTSYTKKPKQQVLSGTDHCSSEGYRCTHGDACGARTWISYRSVPCHLWCTHRTSLVIKKTFFSFSVAVNNSIKVGPLILLL